MNIDTFFFDGAKRFNIFYEIVSPCFIN